MKASTPKLLATGTLSASFLALGVSVVQADVVTVDESGFSDNTVLIGDFSTDGATTAALAGSLGGGEIHDNAGTDPQISSFGLTNFDFNNDGFADTLTWDVTLTPASTGGDDVNLSNARGPGVNGSGNGGINAFDSSGEVLTLSVGNVVVTMGNSVTGYTGTFLGFTGAGIVHGSSSGGVSSYTITDSTQGGAQLATGATSGTTISSEAFAATDVLAFWNPTDDGGHFRISGATYSFNVVPEPSAFALLAGLLSLGWVAIRRRG